jgi:UDPglucose 6-dehydrogenase
MNDANKIGFAGLSHLGIIYSAAAAARGFSVCAFDERPDLVAELTAGRFPVSEPGLDSAFQQHGVRIQYTGDAEALARCPLIFITLDVATSDSNVSDLGPLQSLIEKVTAHAGEGAVVVLMSQVPPGFCRVLAGRLLRKVRFFYQVETLVFGNALERAIHPERYMVGCGRPESGLPEVYRRYLEAFECPVLPMRFESAELCKIAINCFLVSSVATSNTLAEICEHIGADWREIIPALRLDRRIGPHAYLTPGLGIAGGNLERDLVTVQDLAAQNGCDAGIVTAWQNNSRYRRDWVLRHLYRLGLLAQPVERVLATWGLAYKQDTHSTKNSPALALLRALPEYRWRAYDPAARVNRAEFPCLQICASPLETARGADVLVVMTPWKEFPDVPAASVKEVMRGRYVLDPHGVLDREQCLAVGLQYFRLGI